MSIKQNFAYQKMFFESLAQPSLSNWVYVFLNFFLKFNPLTYKISLIDKNIIEVFF